MATVRAIMGCETGFKRARMKERGRYWGIKYGEKRSIEVEFHRPLCRSALLFNDTDLDQVLHSPASPSPWINQFPCSSPFWPSPAADIRLRRAVTEMCWSPTVWEKAFKAASQRRSYQTLPCTDICLTSLGFDPVCILNIWWRLIRLKIFLLVNRNIW